MFIVFFFNDTATTEIYTLSLHDALPIFVLPICHSIFSVVPKIRDQFGIRCWFHVDFCFLRWHCRILNWICNQKGNKDRKSTRLNSSHANISYAVFCLKKKNFQKQLLSLY